MPNTEHTRDLSPELAELERIMGAVPQEAPATVAEEQEPAPPKIPYNRVPYLNDDITFKDREAELTLLIQLLNFRRDQAVRELNYVQNCRDQQYYPGIVHQDPEVG